MKDTSIVISTRSRRGLACVDPVRRREIAAQGGREAHKRGTAHRYSAGSDAVENGRLGGLARAEKRRSFAPFAPFADRPESVKRDIALNAWRKQP